MPEMGPEYGSRQECRKRDFRPKRRKQASDTEVGKGAESETSAPNAENGPLIRKAAMAQGVKSASVAIESPGSRLPGQAF